VRAEGVKKAHGDVAVQLALCYDSDIHRVAFIFQIQLLMCHLAMSLSLPIFLLRFAPERVLHAHSRIDMI
jgi:hypothetical protein